MRRRPPRPAWSLLLFLLAIAAPAAACRIVVLPPRPAPPQVPPPAPTVEMETKSHQVEIRVEKQTATVTLQAVFHNPGNRRLEGTYFFPLPADVAVRDFSFWVGGEEQRAELLDADRARETYERIVRELRDPALLEYLGSRMLRARIFPIEPHADVRVKLTYRHLVRRDDGIYRLSYPLASARPGSTRAVGFVRAGEEPPAPGASRPHRPAPNGRIGQVGIRVRLANATPLKAVYSPTHEIDLTRSDPHHAVAGYEAERVSPREDFELYWTAADGPLDAAVLTHRTPGEEAGTFLLLLAPTVRPAEGEVAAKDIVFVFDKSGSMLERGKIDQARRALRYCLGRLNPQDRFAVVTFSTAVAGDIGALRPATEENRRQAIADLDRLEAAGGTAIDEALRTGLGLLQESENLPMLLFLTDGVPTVGETNAEAILQAAAKQNGAGARIFVFGVGYDVNTKLLDGLAETGRGVREYVGPSETIEQKVSSLYEKIASPVLTDVALEWHGAGVHDIYPRTVPDIFRGGQVSLLGRYRRAGAHRLVVRGRVGEQQRTYTYDLAWGERRGTEALPALWAMRKVGFLLDQIRLNGPQEELIAEVRRLATRHGIVTPYTSFLVVEEGARPLSAARRDELRRDLSRIEEEEARSYADGAAVGARATEKSAAVGRYRGVGPAATPSLETLDAGRSLTLETQRRAAAALRPEKARVGQAEARRAAGKTFLYRDGVWTDTALQDVSTGPPLEVPFLSEEYFELAARSPALAACLALGEKVIVLHEGTVYKIVPSAER